MTKLPMNTIKISLTSFLAYFVMSAMASPLGIISKPIADHYGVSLTQATSTFSYLTTGVLVGTLIAIYIFDYVRFKLIIVGGAAIIAGSIYAMYAVDTFALLPLWLAIIGTLCGLELSAAAVVITETFSERMRAPMLLITDSFYSMSGVISSFLASYFMAKSLHFSSVYALAFGVAVVIVLIGLLSKYSIGVSEDSEASTTVAIKDRPVSIHLISAAIFTYLLGFVCIYSWVPNYAQATFGAGVEESGQLVSRMFLGMFIGQLITFFIVLKFPIKNLLIIYAILAVCLNFMLWNVDSVSAMGVNMLILGLVAGGLFKVLLSYSTTTVDDPDPRLVSYLIFSSALGTSVAPAASAFVVEQSNIAGALQFATVCYALTCLLFIYSTFVNKKERVAYAAG